MSLLLGECPAELLPGRATLFISPRSSSFGPKAFKNKAVYLRIQFLISNKWPIVRLGLVSVWYAQLMLLHYAQLQKSL